MAFLSVFWIILFLVTVVARAEVAVEGYAAIEGRYFSENTVNENQGSSGLSLVLEPEIYSSLSGGSQEINFVPFLRIDGQDDERTHYDVRELSWIGAGEGWEWTLGVSKVFWGVTESQHLVDIVNQTDLIEDPELEIKLGQPMINVTLVRDWGTVEGYVLPWFRERTFPGEEGRLRTAFVVDTNNVEYESSKKQQRTDLALRWFSMIGDIELGVSHFYGTNREPVFIPQFNENGEGVLIPRYEIISQTGVDFLYLYNQWTWKLEAINRRGQSDLQVQDDKDFWAGTGGFEYTYAGQLFGGADINWMLEYMYDSREDDATTPFESDIFAGVRIAVNDVRGTEIRINGIFDVKNSGVIYKLEVSTRLSDVWAISGLARVFSNLSKKDYIYDYRNDDYIEFRLTRFL